MSFNSIRKTRDEKDRAAAVALGEEYIAPQYVASDNSFVKAALHTHTIELDVTRKSREAKDRASAAALGMEYVAPLPPPKATFFSSGTSVASITRARRRREHELQMQMAKDLKSQSEHGQAQTGCCAVM